MEIINLLTTFLYMPNRQRLRIYLKEIKAEIISFDELKFDHRHIDSDLKIYDTSKSISIASTYHYASFKIQSTGERYITKDLRFNMLLELLKSNPDFNSEIKILVEKEIIYGNY